MAKKCLFIYRLTLNVPVEKKKKNKTIFSGKNRKEKLEHLKKMFGNVNSKYLATVWMDS